MAANAPQPPPPPVTDPSNPKIQKWPDIGLTLIHDFITEAEEEAMISAFQAASPSPTSSSSSSSRKRLSQHFGHHFDYTTFGASTHFTPVPSYIRDFLLRLPVREYEPDQFTVQYYPPGAGIPPHVDTHSMFEEALYSLSFGGAVPMAFRLAGRNEARKMRLPKRSLLAASADAEGGSAASPAANQSGAAGSSQSQSHEEDERQNPSWELLLPRRSLLLMTGPSRYGYTHGIKGRKTDVIDGEPVLREGRYSITMRTVRRGSEVRCDCAYPGVCDARIREEQEQQARNGADT